MKFTHPARFIGTWFGVGYAPFAAGTFTSIAALPFAWVIQTQLGSVALFWASWIIFYVGVWACNAYLPHTDRKDPREMSIDEVAGQWLLLSMLYPTFNSYLVGLLLFRFFDIVKPWPISVADKKVDGGFGVMFDDMLAAVYPAVIVALCVGVGHVIAHPFPLVELQQFLASSHVL